MKTSVSAPLGGLTLATLLWFSISPAYAQAFTGSNTPGSASDFSFTVGVGVAGISVNIDNTPAAYSHLLVKKGAPPTDIDYDFIGQMDGRDNSIHLQPPELAAGAYFVKVRTPASSQQHDFHLRVEGNPADLGGEGKPVFKPMASVVHGVLTPGERQYFRVEVPAAGPGWRLALSSSGPGDPNLFVRKGETPSEFLADKSSVDQAVDTLIFSDTEASGGVYFIGVFLPSSASGNANYALQSDVGYLTALAWDPGTTHVGTEVFQSSDSTGGDYYFKITTQSAGVGAWRTALTVVSGEADVYLSYDSLPSTWSHWYASQRIGSDGFVLSNGEFQPGQNWYIMVHATAGSRWSLVTGEAFVQNLGMLASDGSSGSGEVVVGPEGLRLFQTSAPGEALAWRLWLNGQNNQILLRRGMAPTRNAYELAQNGQMLVVPDYLSAGQAYFVGVPGDPGSTINLDSRQQGITDLGFASNTTLTVEGYGYTTYRVQVPVQQIAWQLNVVPEAGNPNLAVRRGLVPNEFNNDALSEVASPVTDSLTLVPPTLSDGTFYVTVYGTAPHRFTLQSGNPVITDVPYVGSIINDDPNRSGWRFYRVPNIQQQLGTLGWDLFLQSQPPGTEIALRRNAVPGRWNYRQSGGEYSAGHVDYSGSWGFLQRPAHQADIWYIGVYSPGAALGSFQLTTRHLSFENLDFDGGVRSRSQVAAGKWQFFRVEVPAGCIGWDIRLEDAALGYPQMVVRRDQLAESVGGGLAGSPNWPSGASWAGGVDWTGYYYAPDGAYANVSMLAMGTGRPLEPGTYYVGVINGVDQGPMTYSIASRGIGGTLRIPVADLPFSGGMASASGLAPRQAAYYRVEIPPNTASWKVRLTPTTGECLLLALKDALPSVGAALDRSAVEPSSPGKKMQKEGADYFLLLPADGQALLDPGTYYLAVVSEGVGPRDGRVGVGGVDYSLETLGEMAVQGLGALGGADLAVADSLPGGDVKAYQFEVSAGTAAVEVRLDDRAGNPAVAVRPGLVGPPMDPPGLPTPGVWLGWWLYYYGQEGGQSSGRQEGLGIVTIANPLPGVYTLLVKATHDGAGTFPDASYTLRIRATGPQPVGFADDQVAVSAQEPGSWRFFKIEVPAGADGWDLRLVNVVGGNPQLVVRRDLLPDAPAGWLGDSPTWPPGSSWLAGMDWTGAGNTADGLPANVNTLAMGMGRPLAPGVYYAGVSTVGNTERISYNLRSRGIGEGLAIPVESLAFAGGSATRTELGAREAAYYKVEVPAGAKSWKLRLTPTAGEAALLVLKDAVPNVGSSVERSALSESSAGKKMQKSGPEFFALLPADGQSELVAGNYYLGVVSEGVEPKPGEGRIGTGEAAFTIESVGELPVANLGVLGGVDISQPDSLLGGDSKAYQFEVPAGTSSVEVRLENRSGNPIVSLRPGAGLPVPGMWLGWWLYYYGQEGGQSASRLEADELVTLANPTPGMHSLFVKAAHDGSGLFPDAAYTLRVHAVGGGTLDFDNGHQLISGQGSGTWRFFKVEVPANAVGWDVRAVNVTGGNLQMVVRRGQLPETVTGFMGDSTDWPAGAYWAVSGDWTGYGLTPEGESANVATLAVGRGPLEPGVYYVGILNQPGNPDPLTYELVSRGIGPEFSITVADIEFAGGRSEVSGVVARDAAYYRVQVPFNVPSWKVRLTPAEGEASLLVRKGALPNVAASAERSAVVATSAGKKMQKAGSEHYLLLPNDGETALTAGTYYLAVVSEGANPRPSEGRIGTGSSGWVLESLGPMGITDLGSVGSADIEQPASLLGGEIAGYRFAVPVDVPAVEVRLDERVGNPAVSLRAGTGMPIPNIWLGWWLYGYGQDGGQSAGRAEAPSIITIPGPVAGPYSVAVKATHDGAGKFPDAGFKLHLRQMAVGELNFSSDENGNGHSHEVSGVLLDNQRAFYKVVVPASHRGGPVIGWKLEVAETQGTAHVRVRRDQLPSDFEGGLPFGGPSVIVVPPFLGAGTWYVEVRGTGVAAYTLTSSALELERPAWVMPPAGQPSVTPGLTAPDFGDTGVDAAGAPLPGDQGVDLEQGHFHYYAVRVPHGNAGLFRTLLEAISGNPNLYLRVGEAPTLSHNESGYGGYLVERSLTGTTTEYGNWVPHDGRTELELRPGTWYLAVQAAGDSNVRYRLRLSTGSVQNLALQGGSLTRQTLAAGDWRYYRVEIPVNPPPKWNITFAQHSGDVILHLRDTVPPGLGANVLWWEATRDWSTDAKFAGPFPTFDEPGTHTLLFPPLRPAHVYYLGFRAVSDATFSVGSTTTGVPLEIPTIQFYGGVIDTVIPAHDQVIYRIDVPPDGVRWRHTSMHTDQVRVYLQQGTLPSKNASDHWQSSTADSMLSQPLSGWPWVPNQYYFLIAANESDSALPFRLTMDGRNASNDDEDLDGLPDSWELQYFGNTWSQDGAGDPDGDGNSNLVEARYGTNPTDPASYRPMLTINAVNGSVSRDPDMEYYPLGTTVTLTAVPAAGYGFERWSGAVVSSQNRVRLVMDGHKTVTAQFGTANDNFASRSLLTGAPVNVTASNSNATREAGEPAHAGGSGDRSLWWSWVAPRSGRAIVSTVGSTFDTLLGIYAGDVLATLASVASDDDSGGNGTSRAAFNVIGGRSYEIAVDGWFGAAGTIQLSVELAAPPRIGLAPAAEPGAFEVSMTGAVGERYVLEVSTDLDHWSELAVLDNTTGVVVFTDRPGAAVSLRFYRMRLQ